jgi:hypothetical protein
MDDITKRWTNKMEKKKHQKGTENEDLEKEKNLLCS